MKKLLSIYFLSGTIFCMVGINASAQQRTNDAILCSAVYYIATSISDNQEVQTMFMKQQEVFQLIHAANTKGVMSNGAVSELRHKHMVYLRELYDRAPDEVYNIEMQCSCWRDAFAPHLIRASKSAQTLEQMKKEVKRFPPICKTKFDSAHPRWKKSVTLMDVSFSNWSKNGRVTPYEVKQKLFEDIEEDD